MTTKSMISIWFFIGCLITIYGALILNAGLRPSTAPAAENLAMQNLHLQIFWGIGMLLLGLCYLIRFRPRR